MRTRIGRLLVLVAALALGHGNTYGGVQVFYDNFDGGKQTLPGVIASWSGFQDVRSVAGYGTIGFSGNFLMNWTGGYPQGTAGERTVLVLENLPVHDHVDLDFLLAVIDSWDGASGGYAPDYLNVLVDGQSVFSNAFSTFDPHNNGYTEGLFYHSDVPGHDGRLWDSLAFNTEPDSAYDMSLNAALSNIPHTGSQLTIEWYADGTGWEGGHYDPDARWNEAWALENVTVTVNSAVPEPTSVLVWCVVGGLAIAVGWRRRRRAA